MTNSNIAASLHRLNVPTGWMGKPLEPRDMIIQDFKVDTKYQREISPTYIAKGGQFDLSLYTPILVCQRPDTLEEEDRGFYVYDGQHRLWRAKHSGYAAKYPLGVLVYVHEEDATLEECVAIESAMFVKHNTLGKKPSKLDEVRAGIHCDNEIALRILDVLEHLDLQVDTTLGAQHAEIEVEVFNHFYYLCTADYKHGNMKIAHGWDLYQRMFDVQIQDTKLCNGYMLRACCLIAEFLEEISAKRRRDFTQFLENEWNTRVVKDIVKGRANMQSPQFVLCDTIKSYNSKYGVTPMKDAYLKSVAARTGNNRFAPIVPVD